MRRLFCFFSVCILTACSTRLAAQRLADEYSTFYGGVIGGVNFSQIDGDNFAGYNKVGFNVGAIVYTKFDEHIAASLEILYSQKGSRSTKWAESETPGIYVVEHRIKLNYAEVPVMINYFDRRKSHFGAGLSYSQLATSTETFRTSPVQNYDLNKFPFKKMDLNFILGGDLHLYHGLFLNLRFQYSLISIRDTLPASNRKASQFSNMWVMRLMYLF
ncbi:MAG: porin family protein [Bacteroidota bacterium]